MTKEGKIEESYLWNTIGFVLPLLLARMHVAIVEAVNGINHRPPYFLLATFGLFWPFFIIGAALAVKQTSLSQRKVAAQCTLISSVIAAIGFYGCLPAILCVVSCY